MTRIAILTGGESSERDIALQSAQNVARALKSRFAVETFDLPRDMDRFLATRRDFACAVPVFHGKGGESGEIQGFLNTLGIPFIFSDVAAHAIGMDKAVTKSFVSAHGIRTPSWRQLASEEHPTYVRPIVVKPADAGSSVGVTIARSQKELEEGIARAKEHSTNVLIEDYIEGDEFTCAIIEENGASVALPVIQIKSKNSFFDRESKYDPSLFEEICPAPISDHLAREIQEISMRAHELIGARHVSRSDFIFDRDGVIWFLEINTIPGMTENSLLPKAVGTSGRTLGGVLESWILEIAGFPPSRE